MTSTVETSPNARRAAAAPSDFPIPDFPDSSTEAALLAWTLARAGFPAIVRLGDETASPRSGITPEFALHLKNPLPIPDLLRALIALRGKRAPSAILLTSRRTGRTPYREHLQLDADRYLTAIRRRFVKRFRRARPAFIGIAWKIAPAAALAPDPDARTPRAPLPGPPWHTLRVLYRQARRGILRRILTLDVSLLPSSSEICNARHPYFTGPVTRRRPVYEFAKRLFDIAFSLFAILITLPICLPIALLIKLHDRGPIFFRHRRETLHGRPFPCLKFRTMVTNAEALKLKLREKNQVDGPQFKMASDPRVTPLGNFLRKTNIDELPQFLNVLAGHMSVVGPRPSPFEENQLCPAWREARLSVKPGITGLWQISRSKTRGPTDFQEWIFFDTQYVERRSFLLDIRILLLTVKELLGNGQ